MKNSYIYPSYVYRLTKSAFFLFVVLICCHLKTNSQNFPVQLSTQLGLPYSGYVADYASNSSDKLKLYFVLNDFSVPSVQVKLHLEIIGNGFMLSTKQTFYAPPILLNSGQPELISGSDLLPYLSSGNLDFTGISQSTYESMLRLPEGYYSICVKAYEYYTGKQISNESCAQAWFVLGDPPFLNTPYCGASIAPLPIQNISFQWNSMAVNSPNTNLPPEYDFYLWEIRPDSTMNPNQVALTMAPLYSVTLSQTFLNYGLTEPPLNLYTKYVWRVRVRDQSGRDLYKNNGFSQVCTFVYGSAQQVLGGELALQITAETYNHRTADCSWNTQSAYTKYLLQVRKEGTTEWFDYECMGGKERVRNLEQATTYECRVRGEGNGITGEWSNTAEFTTHISPAYSCNQQYGNLNVQQTAPLPLVRAVKGLIFQSGLFEVKVTEISATGVPGWYAGKGYTSVLGLKKVPVKWSNIFIDEESQHQQGIIEAMTQGVDSWLGQWDKYQAEQHATYVDGKIDSVYVSGNQVCYSFSGSSNVVCVTAPANANTMVIRDNEGNQFTVYLNPPPPVVKGPESFVPLSTDTLGGDAQTQVNFKASPTQKYGFDKKEYAAYLEFYERIELKDGSDYFVANKSILKGQDDEVLAEVNIPSFDAALLLFATEGGKTLSAVPAGNANTYKVSGISDSALTVYAIYNGSRVGKLNLMSMKPKQMTLKVVTVNGAASPVDMNQLNAIYKQAGAFWQVSTVSGFTFNFGANGLDLPAGGLLHKYSEEMRNLRTAFQQFDSTYDKTAYYLFVVPGFSDEDVEGFMPRARAFGFVKSGSATRIAAHELAHGAFGLEHTFPAIEKGSSNNLMDYNGGTQLAMPQWMVIQRGNYKPTWFDEEEDGEISNIFRSRQIYELINKIRNAYRMNSKLELKACSDIILEMENGKLGGMTFSKISVLIKNSLVDRSIFVRNQITNTYLYEQDNGTDLWINYNIRIRVPLGLRNAMRTYLELEGDNLILFINGYRPIVNFDDDNLESGQLEYEDSNNTIETGDSRNYWKGIDIMFMNRIGTRSAIYADGHHSVKTSNHRSVGAYGKANAAALILSLICSDPNDPLCISEAKSSKIMHTIPHVYGFQTRRISGQKAGQDLINKINSGQLIFNKSYDTLDIVAHSMGYAYALGVIDVLKKVNIRFGRFYILAPENACSGSPPWNLFTEAWQYGSNLDQENPDPIWQQDGVAPQCGAIGLDNEKNSSKRGRIFIPLLYPDKGFLACHTVANYDWIFNTINNDQPGYIKAR